MFRRTFVYTARRGAFQSNDASSGVRRAWTLLLLAGALVLQASLYLPWQEASCPAGTCGRLIFPAEEQSIDGWLAAAGSPALVLFALVAAGFAGAAVMNPRLEARLPLGRSALLASYFALALEAQVRSAAAYREAVGKEFHFHYAYGAYLGLGGAVLA